MTEVLSSLNNATGETTQMIFETGTKHHRLFLTSEIRCSSANARKPILQVDVNDLQRYHSFSLSVANS